MKQKRFKLDISDNIKNLLYQHDCVILPGFGGFVANYKPAEVDYNRNIFAPPSKDISFNSQLTHNDGLLISDVSYSSGLAYLDAKRNVENYIKELKSRLENGRKVVIDELGTFLYNKEKNLQFEPDKLKNYLIDSIGLSTFEFSLLEEYDVRKRIQSKFRASQKNVNRRKIIKRTLIAVPVLAALVLVPLKTNLLKTNTLSFNPFNQNTEITHKPASPLVQEEASFVQPVSEASPEETESLNEKEVLVPGDKPEEVSSEIVTETLSSVEPVIVQERRYDIVAGSFKNKDNANRLSNSLLKEGYNAELLEAPNGFYRVLIEGSPVFVVARKEMYKFKYSHPGENYWLLKR
ncbi:MAG: SPOR domain-containing protein [Bacteroidales bacterium]|nr:SPOR domain-containing protein [Bacteroidales bacterium]